MTRHEKTGLMYTKYTCSYCSKYLPYCIRFSKSVSCMRLLSNCCISGENCVRFPCSHRKLCNFGIQKCGQILCVHKTLFLMPGHIYASDFSNLTQLVVELPLYNFVTRVSYH